MLLFKSNGILSSYRRVWSCHGNCATSPGKLVDCNSPQYSKFHCVIIPYVRRRQPTASQTKSPGPQPLCKL